MEIYVVQPGDDLDSIASKYGVTVDKLIKDNGLTVPVKLVLGQALVITFPKQSHTVQEGDTLQSIAKAYEVTQMQLLRNNPGLFDRDSLTPGESLVIRYNTVKSITTNGFAYPYVKPEILVKTLPNLTYLSVFNYTAIEGGEIISYYDDTEIVNTSIAYGVVPLLMLTTLTPWGSPNVETAYNILLNEEYQDRNINEMVKLMRNHGYLGLNIIFNFLSEINETLYLRFLQKISERLLEEGFLFFVTINYNIEKTDGTLSIEPINYSELSTYVNGIIFLRFVWGNNYGPPTPVSNINNLRTLIEHVIKDVPSEKIIIGKPILGYDWKLPYEAGISYGASLTINSVFELAGEVDTVIQFDEDSQTPYYYYDGFSYSFPSEHIVWFIDARSISVLDQLMVDYDVYGSGVWNIMVYYQQLWTVINARFDIIKLI